LFELRLTDMLLERVMLLDEAWCDNATGWEV